MYENRKGGGDFPRFLSRLARIQYGKNVPRSLGKSRKSPYVSYFSPAEYPELLLASRDHLPLFEDLKRYYATGSTSLRLAYDKGGDAVWHNP